MTNRQKMYLERGEKLVEVLQRKGFEAQIVENRKEVAAKVLELIPAEHVVAWGGSVTLNECGVLEAVKKERQVIDRDKAATPEEKTAMMRDALLSDTFLMSANGIGMDGTLANIDGTGNRTAALIYGPKQVIVVAGMNKVMPNAREAMQRAWHEAGPLNMQRFPNKKCGCSGTGVCVECNSPESICNQFLLTRRCNPKGRIKIILVAEDLGY